MMPEKNILSSSIKDNPNPHARIGFVVFYPFQFYVFKDTHKYLGSEAEFIVDMGSFFPVEQPEELLFDIINLLQKNKVYFRILYHKDYFFEKYLISFFSQYEALVSLWKMGCVGLACNVNRKKIHMTYGIGKDLVTYGAWKRIFDLILAYGPRDHKLFSLYTQCQIVGNPKFDDWFNDNLDEETLSTIGKILDSNKKTLLYLPTHSDLSSIDDLAGELKKISFQYNVLVKLHYYTPREEPERVKKLENKNITILQDDVDLLPLLKLADVVISDNSSAIFDVILADRPILATDFHSKEYLDNKHKEPKHYRRGIGGALTYSGSIEQEIKKQGLILNIKRPEELDQKIEEALGDDDFYRKARANIREKLFSFNDGKCGERAAKAIKSFLAQKETPDRPFMYHAIENLLVNVSYLPNLKRSYYEIELSKYKKALHKDVEDNYKDRCLFSIIICNKNFNFNKNQLKLTLQSAILQDFPKNNFEIITEKTDTTDAMLKEIKKELSLDEDNLPKIQLLEKDKEDQYLLRSINNSGGKFVCFLGIGCIAPSNWLNNFHLIYQEFPQLGGAGGSFICEKDSTYAEFYYQTFGRRLGIHKEFRYLRKAFFFKNSLFFQNPAGDLRNMSYKKTILKDYTNTNSITDLYFLDELKMKKFAINHYEIGYTPNFVRELNRIDFYEFCRQNFLEGMALGIFLQNNQEYRKILKLYLLSPFRLSILNLIDGYFKIRLTPVIFLGNFFRLLGKWYSFFLGQQQNKRS